MLNPQVVNFSILCYIKSVWVYVDNIINGQLCFQLFLMHNHKLYQSKDKMSQILTG